MSKKYSLEDIKKVKDYFLTNLNGDYDNSVVLLRLIDLLIFYEGGNEKDLKAFSDAADRLGIGFFGSIVVGEKFPKKNSHLKDRLRREEGERLLRIVKWS